MSVERETLNISLIRASKGDRTKKKKQNTKNIFFQFFAYGQIRKIAQRKNGIMPKVEREINIAIVNTYLRRGLMLEGKISVTGCNAIGIISAHNVINKIAIKKNSASQSHLYT